MSGCKSVLAKAPGIKLLSSDQDAKGSGGGGLAMAQVPLTRFEKVDAYPPSTPSKRSARRSRPSK